MAEISKQKYRKLKALRANKVSVYMNPGQKWLIEELAHRHRKPQKAVLDEIIEYYWCNALNQPRESE